MDILKNLANITEKRNIIPEQPPLQSQSVTITDNYSARSQVLWVQSESENHATEMMINSF